MRRYPKWLEIVENASNEKGHTNSPQTVTSSQPVHPNNHPTHLKLGDLVTLFTQYTIIYKSVNIGIMVVTTRSNKNSPNGKIMVAMAQISLSRLPPEVLFSIFDHLDRPSRLTLGLSSPHYLQLLAKYLHFELYNNKNTNNHHHHHHHETKHSSILLRETTSNSNPSTNIQKLATTAPDVYPAMVRWLCLSDVSAPHVLKRSLSLTRKKPRVSKAHLPI